MKSLLLGPRRNHYVRYNSGFRINLTWCSLCSPSANVMRTDGNFIKASFSFLDRREHRFVMLMCHYLLYRGTHFFYLHRLDYSKTRRQRADRETFGRYLIPHLLESLDWHICGSWHCQESWTATAFRGVPFGCSRRRRRGDAVFFDRCQGTAGAELLLFARPRNSGSDLRVCTTHNWSYYRSGALILVHSSVGPPRECLGTLKPTIRNPKICHESFTPQKMRLTVSTLNSSAYSKMRNMK